jgi:predicted lipoprotein with Yx(FWY)xxD motif
MDMGGTGKKPVEGKASSDPAKKWPPKRVEDDDEEDGDFATPKRDRSGEDDQPL